MARTATVIGSGVNGLSAAIVLAQAGFDVEVHEAAPVIGGAARSGELTLPGFTHDLGSAVHPMAVSSPFFAGLPLARHGLEWIWPEASLAHPLDDGTAVMLERDVADTARQFGPHAQRYQSVFDPLVRDWATLFREVFRPMRIPRHPFLMARFGVRAMQPMTVLGRYSLRSRRAAALLAGVAAHSCLTMTSITSGGFALLLGAAGHAVGWPIPRGGSQSISNALAGVLRKAGGRIYTDSRIDDLAQVGGRDLVLCDITPRQLLRIAGGRLAGPYRESLEAYRYGPGVFKMDWALQIGRAHV